VVKNGRLPEWAYRSVIGGLFTLVLLLLVAWVYEVRQDIEIIKNRYDTIPLIQYRIGVVEQKIDLLLERSR